MKVWSTDEVSPRQALSYWKDAVCDAFLRVQTEYSDFQNFRGRITSTAIGNVVANDVVSQSHVVRRDRRGIGRDSDAWFFVNLHRAGSCTLTQDGHRHAPTIGDFSFHDGTRPFDLDFRENMALTCFVVPQSALLARTTDARAAVARPLPHIGAGALFRSYACSLADAAPLLSVAEGAQAGAILVDLLSLALGATGSGRDAARPAARLALFQHVCAQIRLDLADPALDLASAAQRAGMAPRTLQTLFHDNGRSFSEFVTAERLRLADRLLSSDSRMSVTAVAYAVGFSDLSHFSRTFRRHFGLSAKERRASAEELPATGSGDPSRSC